MKFKEIKETPAKELDLKLTQNRSEQMALRIKKSSGQLEKPHMLRSLRKDAARIQTALTQGRQANQTKKTTSTTKAK